MREEALQMVKRWRDLAARYERIGKASLSAEECARYAHMHGTLRFCASELERISEPQSEGQK